MTFIFWLQFATVCVAGAMSPGPSLALIIRNSITINRFAGFMTAVGIGSDYDGLDCLPHSWNDCLDHMIIQESLEKRGYKFLEIEKIMGKNILRVLEEIYN